MKTIRVRIKLTGATIRVTKHNDVYISEKGKLEYKGSEIVIL